MPTDHHPLLNSLKQPLESFLWCARGKDLLIAMWSGMAEQYLSEIGHCECSVFWKLRQKIPLVWR
jgi:hypothetical protein